MTASSLPQSPWPKLGCGLAALASIWGMWSAPDGQARWAASLAALGASGALVALRKTPKSVGSAPEPELTLPKSAIYRSSWVRSDDPTQQQHPGRAEMVSFGDRLVFRHQDDTHGVYILDLKRISEHQVSGIWWFYGNNLAQGIYKGTISSDGSEIMGTWHDPNGGPVAGSWTLQASSESSVTQ